ncbi:oxidoreductase [Cereibacter changlensis]|uniref:Oxidoreductase n=1 Tax=Cereibacter changlensis TaxID=402884 RepID=A0A4U0Z0F7_9RHOB|nr:proton-conducting transporter membrane subunit [Cereibacter changlensis]TKA94883.1 oxidoreductase [Cereibacter changlensis]
MLDWLTWYHILLLVPSPPLAAFLVLGLDPFKLGKRAVQGIALLGGVAPFLVMAPMTGFCIAGSCNGIVPVFTLYFGQSEVALALLLDPLSALVGITVATIGAAVMTYAVDYMSDAKIADLRRFFALMNLFIAAMLTMVLADDSITFFFGWELMGLCSFFLIAYNTGSSQAIAAGRKAFIITRVADAFLLAGLLLLFLEANSVRLETLIPVGAAIDGSRRTIIALLLLGGALGKSAQVPFHTWLPSAMAGPTPVSALLHSATMVAAGAFLLVRFAPVLDAEPFVRNLTALCGVITAGFGALLALFQTDVKRLLAYSSISQVGFMIFAVGLGAPEVAVAHFVVHAMFKSLLFLAAGDITHGSEFGTSMVAMQGALQRRPASFATYVVGAASLAGVPFITAGWWSKEAILSRAWNLGLPGYVLWALALATAVLTAAYAFRPVLAGLVPAPPSMTRGRRGHAVALGTHYRARMPGPLILGPLLVLSLGSVLGGLLVAPIVGFLGAVLPHAAPGPELAAGLAPVGGLIIAAALTFIPRLSAGLASAKRMRRATALDHMAQGTIIEPFVRLVRSLSKGARIDALYQATFVRPFVNLVRWLNGYRGGTVDPVGTLPVLFALRGKEALVARMAEDGFDRRWMGFANGMVRLWVGARRVQTGRARDYALGLATGLAALLMIAWGTTWN